jgi:hypothetical protein
MQSVEDDMYMCNEARAHLDLYDKIIKQKTEQLDRARELIRSLETYAAGSREVIEKNEIKLKEFHGLILDLFSNHTVDLSTCMRLLAVHDEILEVGKSATRGLNQTFAVKQTEIALLSQDIESAREAGAVCQKKIDELEIVIALQKRKKEREHRPDQDPSTPQGRAALDITARKNRNKKI